MTYQPAPASLSRQGFIVVSLSAAGGMMLGLRGADAAGTEPGAWLVIDPDNSVTIRVSKSEMGQGIYTALPMLVAEELRCDWRKVKVEHASANRNLIGRPYGSMSTGGSRPIRSLHAAMQQIGASARLRLITAAARQWDVPVAACDAREGEVHHTASGRVLGFGALAPAAARLQIKQEPPITPPDRYTFAGRPVARVDTTVKCTGETRFGIDVRLPGMVYAASRCARCQGEWCGPSMPIRSPDGAATLRWCRCRGA